MFFEVGELGFAGGLSDVVVDPPSEGISFAFEHFEVDPTPEFAQEIGDGTLIFEATGRGGIVPPPPLPPDPPLDLSDILAIILGLGLGFSLMYFLIER